jgi:hypothetical protein
LIADPAHKTRELGSDALKSNFRVYNSFLLLEKID